jgi:hypothetical protein
MTNTSLVAQVGPQTNIILVSYTIPNSAASGTVAQGSVAAFGPLVGATNPVVVPSTDVWLLEDMWVVGGPAFVDAQVMTILNGIPQNFYPTLSSMNQNTLTRFRLSQKIPIYANYTFASTITTLAAGPATGGTQVVQYQVQRGPA